MHFILTAALAFLGLRAIDQFSASPSMLASMLGRAISAIQHSPQVMEIFGNPSLLLGGIYLLFCYGAAGELLAALMNFRAQLFQSDWAHSPMMRDGQNITAPKSSQ